jgi:O-succinylbenzoic acid--CoA ligase
LTDLGFYFDRERAAIDWEGRATLVMANPEWVRRDRPAIERDSAALPDLEGHLWVATSGSSRTVPGHIRWVALSKRAFLASADAVNRHLQAFRSDVWAHALPVFHVGGLGILARAWLSGAAVVAAVTDRWDAVRFQRRADDAHATLAALVPSQLHDLVGARLRAPASMRAVVVGGARLDPELCADARGLGWPCLPSYGLTETCSQVATAALDTGLSTDCRSPLPVLAHAEIRADADRLLRVRAASLLSCYAEMTDEGMRTWDPKADGWLSTEDIGRVTPAGVEVLGRGSDSVKVLGEMVSVVRVEDVVKRWLATGAWPGSSRLDVAVVALPHGRLGHEIVVALAGADRVDLEPLTGDRLWPSLEAFCREGLLAYERPRRIVWVDRIPRTALGKCQRQLLAGEMSLQAGPEG